MTQYLHDYFRAHAEQAIAGMKEGLQAQSFYKRLEMRLAKGEDLSGEVPLIKQVGSAGALEVVQQAIEENKIKMTAVWDLPAKVQALGRLTVKMHNEPFEHLPRVNFKFEYKAQSGPLTIQIKTAGENFTIELTTASNKMASEMSMRELEKDISLALLAS